MKRSSFIKSLAVLFVAPKLIIEFAQSLGTSEIANISSNSSLINDLQLVLPKYYESFVEKYGNESFTDWSNISFI